MKVSFYPVYSPSTNFKQRMNRHGQHNNTKPKKVLFGDIGLSLGIGVAMGTVAAGIMRHKKLPNIFSNSFEIGSVFGYLTYMGTLISTPFRGK